MWLRHMHVVQHLRRGEVLLSRTGMLWIGLLHNSVLREALLCAVLREVVLRAKVPQALSPSGA
jgi:hypothetical protein